MKKIILISSLFIVFIILVSLNIGFLIEKNLMAIRILTSILSTFCFIILLITAVCLKDASKSYKENKAKSRYLSSMSHDIRTPINGIMGMTIIAKNNIEEKEVTMDCLNKIMDTSTHLLSLINEILDISKIESGKNIMKYNSVDLLESLKICYDIASGQAVENNIHLEQEIDIKNRFVLLDDLHFRKILINIIGNSIKFSHKNGIVKIQVKEIPVHSTLSRFIFKIQDSGCGMEKDFISRIYEPFFQEKETKNGSGLGMAIVKKFIDLMGGTIKIESKKNVGSSFVITLDLEIVEESKEKIEEKTNLSILNHRKILLVEDNDINREIGISLLSTAGIVVDTAINGQVAVEKYNSQYDIVLMDIMMPVMDGLEATKRIRKNDPNAVIIGMTANAYEEDKDRSIAAGMNDYIVKPFDIDKVYKTLIKYCK